MSLMVALQPGIGLALVVGGGAVAARKVAALLDAGFTVRVVAPDLAPAIDPAQVDVQRRPFRDDDLHDAGLAFACTDDREVNRRVGEAARERGIPVNVADAPAESTFYSVATHRDGDVVVGVSTGAAGPRIAAAIRDEVAANLSAGWPAKAAASREARTAAREVPR